MRRQMTAQPLIKVGQRLDSLEDARDRFRFMRHEQLQNVDCRRKCEELPKLRDRALGVRWQVAQNRRITFNQRRAQIPNPQLI